MKQSRNWLFIAVLFAIAAPVSAETASQVFQQVSPSIVVVVTYDSAGKPAELGSGVMLPNHDVATNCHVLKDGTQYRVRYRDKDYPAQLDKSDWDHDVCSLSVPGLLAPPVVLGNTQSLQVGAQVYAIGAPEGLQLTLSEGIVSSLRPVGGGSYIQTTAAISPGSSGGGLFDDQGHLLGLTSFYMAQGQQLNFALPVEWIEALPQRSTQRLVQRVSEVDWLNRAVGLEKEKDWDGLLQHARRWVRAQPQSVIAWITIGTAYAALNQMDRSKVAFERAVKVDPSSPDAWYELGGTYAYFHQYASAKNAFLEVLKFDQTNSDGWFALGDVLRAMNKMPDAQYAYEQVVRLNPDSVKGWFWLGLLGALNGHRNVSIDAYDHLRT